MKTRRNEARLWQGRLGGRAEDLTSSPFSPRTHKMMKFPRPAPQPREPRNQKSAVPGPSGGRALARVPSVPRARPAVPVPADPGARSHLPGPQAGPRPLKCRPLRPRCGCRGPRRPQGPARLSCGPPGAVPSTPLSPGLAGTGAVLKHALGSGASAAAGFLSAGGSWAGQAGGSGLWHLQVPGRGREAGGLRSQSGLRTPARVSSCSRVAGPRLAAQTCPAAEVGAPGVPGQHFPLPGTLSEGGRPPPDLGAVLRGQRCPLNVCCPRRPPSGSYPPPGGCPCPAAPTAPCADPPSAAGARAFWGGPCGRWGRGLRRCSHRVTWRDPGVLPCCKLWVCSAGWAGAT